MLFRSNKLQWISAGFIIAYTSFFAFLVKILSFASSSIKSLGIGIQAIFITLIIIAINLLLNKYKKELPILQNKSIAQALIMYALICIIIALVSINDMPKNLFDLAIIQ